MARAAKSLTKLKAQINARFPYRDKASDGGIGDAAHASRKSDHNPNRLGVFHAMDFDHDPDANGLNCVTLNRELKASRDPRIKYVIFQGRIWYRDGLDKPYTGPNAHMGHLHLSVNETHGDEDTLWFLPMLNTTPVEPVIIPVNSSRPLVPQAYGLTQKQVEQLQRILNAWYPNIKPRLVVDGDPGPLTIERVRFAQKHLKLPVDGIPGKRTLKALGLA